MVAIITTITGVMSVDISKEFLLIRYINCVLIVCRLQTDKL
jgi:hypothetical protein